MNKLNDIHYIAEKFLQDHLASEAHTLLAERQLQEEQKVYIIRDRIPEYFVDFKSNGRKPIWSHDRRYAKMVAKVDFEMWAENIRSHGEDVKSQEV